jgi:hypothetical protein
MGIPIGLAAVRFRAFVHIFASVFILGLSQSNPSLASGTLAFAAPSYSVAATAGSISVSVTRNAGASGAASIQFITAAGTATHGVDYASNQGVLNWADGDPSSKTITVLIFNANQTSTPRTFSINLYNPAGATLGTPATAVVSITGPGSTSPPAVEFSSPTYSVAANAGSLVIAAGRSGGTSGAGTVQYKTVASGSATSGVDYAGTSGTLAWAAGDTSVKTFTVLIFNSNQTSTARTFSVALYNPGSETLGTPATSVVSITGPSSTGPGVVALSSSAYGAQPNAGSVLLTAVRTGTATAAASVHWATVPTGTAVHGVDYGSGAGTLAWVAGDTAPKTFAVTLFNSGQTAAAKTFPVSLSNAAGASLGTPATATVSINGSAAPTVTLTASPTSVAAGAASTLTWTSTNATSCSASGGWRGPLATAGTQGSGPLSANASFSVTCSGTGGTSIATASVAATSGVILSPRTAALTSSRTQQFTAIVPGGGPAIWTVDGLVGGNGTVGVVGSSGLYTAGAAVGAHTVVATSAANSAISGKAVVAVTNLAGVYTYHNNSARDGTNTQEYALTTSTVNAAQFGKLTSCVVDGAISAQPLWAANLTVKGVKRNVVFVATQHGSVYAFDADAIPCANLWSANLIDTTRGATAGETAVPGELVGVGAGDIQPEIGITGTPVIDPASGMLYAVTKSVNSAHTVYYTRLHALDLATGSEKTGSPALITGTYKGTGSGGTTVTFDPHQQLQRSGLALVNGVVYVAFTAHEDKAPWYGWMMSYQYNGSALIQKAIINVAPNRQRGGIWMSGGAPAVDSSNNLYVITGNGENTATSATAPNNDYGNSLLQLTPSLTVSQWFTPSDESVNADQDIDFGSGGAAILADLPAGNTVTHAIIAAGKDKQLFVLNRDLLGGFGDAAAVQKLDLTYATFSTAAYWNNTLYIGGLNAPLRALRLNTSNAQFAISSATSHLYGFAGATPSVSSAATQNGVVWSLDTGSWCTHQSKSCAPVILYAHNAASMSTELWNSSLNANDAAGYGVKFSVPTVANGKVYVGTRGNNIGGVDSSTSVPGELDIYGLKP